jgi:hypothetical protein
VGWRGVAAGAATIGWWGTMVGPLPGAWYAHGRRRRRQ